MSEGGRFDGAIIYAMYGRGWERVGNQAAARTWRLKARGLLTIPEQEAMA